MRPVGDRFQVRRPDSVFGLGERRGVDAGGGVDRVGNRTEEFVELCESGMRLVDLRENNLVDVAGGDDLRGTDAVAWDWDWSRGEDILFYCAPAGFNIRRRFVAGSGHAAVCRACLEAVLKEVVHDVVGIHEVH